MIHGNYPNFEELVNSTNEKGDLVEYILYDFFSENGYETALLKTYFDDKNYPYKTSQRFSKNNKIVIPDLICQKKKNDLLFIESKSRWYENRQDEIMSRIIASETFHSYIKFYNEIFGGEKTSPNTANVLICFSTVDYELNVGGSISMSFIKLNILNDIFHRKTYDYNNKENYLWRESDLKEYYYKNKTMLFHYDTNKNSFYSKSCKNIYAKDRDILIINTEQDMNNILLNYV